MTAELLMMKGIVSELQREDQDRVTACRLELEKVLDCYGDVSILALAIVSLERSKQ